MPRKAKDWEEVSRISIGRDSNEDGYGIEIERLPGNGGWKIDRGGDVVALPDDAAVQNLIEALQNLLRFADQ